MGQVFQWAGCPSCHPTNSFRALQETDHNQWPDLILSLSITRLLKEEALVPGSSTPVPSNSNQAMLFNGHILASFTYKAMDNEVKHVKIPSKNMS